MVIKFYVSTKGGEFVDQPRDYHLLLHGDTYTAIHCADTVLLYRVIQKEIYTFKNLFYKSY
jgi:hypothetical protein